MEKLGQAMDAELRVGHGSDPETTQGPLINARAAEKVNVELKLLRGDKWSYFFFLKQDNHQNSWLI